MVRYRSRLEQRMLGGLYESSIGGTTTKFELDQPFTDYKQTTIDTSHPYFYRFQRAQRRLEYKTRRVGTSPLGIPTFDGVKIRTQPDIGDNFSSTKCTYFGGDWNGKIRYKNSPGTIIRTYEGSLSAYTHINPVFPTVAPIDTPTLHAYGSKARSLVSPANPNTSIGQGIGELRDVSGIPGIPGALLLQNRVRTIREQTANVGSEYLNIEFGWKPIVNDLRAVASQTKKTIELLRQYERNRGRAVRRRFSFPTTFSMKSVPLGSGKFAAPVLTTDLFEPGKAQGVLHRDEYTTQDVWFSGSFTYYVTPGISASKLAAYEAAANRLLGVRLTPDLVWALSPWSWLIDWFVDLGALISGLQQIILDGAVMWYGYVMAHTTVDHNYTLGPITPRGCEPITLWQTFRTEQFQRVRATPFGFGASPNTLSMKQWSILAALGISRV